MLTKLIAVLLPEEKQLVIQLAELERRTPEAQAAWLIREALQYRGLIISQSETRAMEATYEHR